MDVDAALQELLATGILDAHPDRFPETDESRRRARALTALIVMHVRNVTLEEALNSLTAGPESCFADAVHIDDADGGRIPVTVCRTYHRTTELTGAAFACEEDPFLRYISLITDENPRQGPEDLAPIAEEIRSLRRDGYLPHIRILFLGNRMPEQDDPIEAETQRLIARFGNRITIERFTPARLLELVRNADAIDDSLHLSGRYLTEDIAGRRTLVGRISIEELLRLLRTHGERILPRDDRRPFPTTDSRSLPQPTTDWHSFYHQCNGISIGCDTFAYDPNRSEDIRIRLRRMRIERGGAVIWELAQRFRNTDIAALPNAHILIRITQSEAWEAQRPGTNTPTPEDTLAENLRKLGFSYRRKGDVQVGTDKNIIPSTLLAEAVLSIWRESPHQGRFFRKEHFSLLYDRIFSKLNAAQALLAVLIFREVEARRRRSAEEASAPSFLPYASDYIAMLAGAALVKAARLSSTDAIDHRNFAELSKLWEEKKGGLCDEAEEKIERALRALYGDQPVTLQRLSATFRRGDLLEYLN